MKDSLFDLLFNFFEKTITHLKEQSLPANTDKEPNDACESSETMPKVVRVQVEQVNTAQGHSVRVFTFHEHLKLTKASHQFLVRMASWGVISAESLELIINRLIFSGSRYVSLQETKWTIRNTLANGLSLEQAAYLDLILYQKEDSLPLH